MTVRWYNPETKRMEDYNPPPKPDSPFYLMPEFPDYQAVGVDNRIVTSRSEHKQMLKEKGLEELGNEKPAWLKEHQYREKYKGERNG
jgi:hypothetical protein